MNPSQSRITYLDIFLLQWTDQRSITQIDLKSLPFLWLFFQWLFLKDDLSFVHPNFLTFILIGDWTKRVVEGLWDIHDIGFLLLRHKIHIKFPYEWPKTDSRSRSMALSTDLWCGPHSGEPPQTVGFSSYLESS